MKGPPVLLAMDASTPPASVAVVRGEEPLATRAGPFGRGTDAWLLVAVDAALDEAGLELDELDGIAAAVGPGTFTGIRVGVATALGLGHSGEDPVVGVSTLAALAEAARPIAADGAVLACIDARRKELYAALYPSASTVELTVKPEWGPLVASPEDVERRVRTTTGPVTGIGTGMACLQAEAIREADVGAGGLAVHVGRLVARAWRARDPRSLPAAEPLYLRRPDARPRRNPLRRRLDGPDRS